MMYASVIKNRRDVENLFDRLQYAAPTKQRIEKEGLMANSAICDALAQFLASQSEEDVYKRIHEDGFFIELSQDLAKNGFPSHFSRLRGKDLSCFMHRLNDVILTIDEFLGRRYNLKARKNALVESLCRLLNVSLHEPDNMTHMNRSNATFSDTGDKKTAYIVYFSSIMSSTMFAINISAGLARYIYEDDHSISMGSLQSLFSTLIATGLLNSEDCYSGFDDFLSVMRKGLCICLSHYAASNPFLIGNFFTRDNGDAAAHYLQSSKSISMYQYDDVIDYTSFHQATFFVSMFWAALTYIVFFGMSRPFRAFLMALHIHSLGVAHIAHQVPMSGGPECALSASTLTRPSLFKRAATLAIEETIVSDHRNQLIRFKNNAGGEDVFSGDIRFRSRYGDSVVMSTKVATDHAMNYLDIMSSYLKTLAHPILYDAYVVGNRLSKINKNLYPPRYVMNALNAMSVAPCWIVPTRGFTVEAMNAYVKKIIETQSAHYELYKSKSVTESASVMAVASLLQPTIKAFLYAHRTRSFAPSDVECLGIQGYHKTHKIDSTTAKFLNQTDRYFFKYLKTNLGLMDDDRFGNVDRFFNYVANVKE